MSYKVEAVFKGIDQMTMPINQMSNKAMGFANRLEDRFTKLSTRMEKINRGILGTGRAALYTAAAVGLPFAKISRDGMDFERAVLGATTKLDTPIAAGAKAFTSLSRQIESAAKGTKFFGRDAALSFENFAASGYDAANSIIGIRPAMDLALAGQMELGATTMGLVDIMSAFNMKTEDSAQNLVNMRRVSDGLVKGANVATTSVSQLMEAITNGGDAAKAAGSDIETFISIAAHLGNIKDFEAGTGIKLLYKRLQPVEMSKQKLISGLGLQVGYVKDTIDKAGILHKKGSFRDMLDILDDLQKKLRRYTPVQQGAIVSMLFGTEGKAAQKIMNRLMDIPDAIRKTREEIYKAKGYTGVIANLMQGDAWTAWEKFTKSINSINLRIFEKIREPLKDILEKITAWAEQNKELISMRMAEFFNKIGRAILWIADNLQLVVDTSVKVGATMAIFWGIERAVKAASAAIALYNLVLGKAALMTALPAAAPAVAKAAAGHLGKTTAVKGTAGFLEKWFPGLKGGMAIAGAAQVNAEVFRIAQDAIRDSKGARDEFLRSRGLMARPSSQTQNSNFRVYLDNPQLKAEPLPNVWEPGGSLRLINSAGM